MKTIAVIGRKGGIGKTTTALELAYGLALTKRRVLMIDLDVQANLTKSAMKEDPEIYIGQILLEAIPPSALFDTGQKNLLHQVLPKPEKALSSVDETLDLLASDLNDESLTEVDDLNFAEHAGLIEDLLSRYALNYDYCIIDTPAHLGFLSLDTMNAADSLILPVKAEISSIDGLGQFLEYYRQIKELYNPKLEIEGVLITDFHLQGKLYAKEKQELTDAAEAIGLHVFPRAIRHSVKQYEAYKHGISIFDYCPRHKIVEDYIALLNEIIDKE